MKSDIEIAQEAVLWPIQKVAEHLDIPEDDLELYGKYKAKLSDEYLKSIEDRKDGKLILVTAINPTPAGEGKTTTSVGLGEAFAKMGKKAVIALREPSLGPCFGIKGGAAGGGYAQVVPMEDLNLHFTGDFHAITSGGAFRQPYPARQCTWDRPQTDLMETLRGYERPRAEKYRCRSRCKSGRRCPGRPFRDHRRF